MRISWGYWNDFCDRLAIGEINREIAALRRGARLRARSSALRRTMGVVVERADRHRRLLRAPQAATLLSPLVGIRRSTRLMAARTVSSSMGVAIKGSRRASA
jgi:hypothetical protein